MLEARIIDAITPLILCAALLTLAALLLSEDRRLRRQARAAEERARPHSVHVGTAADHAAALMTARIREDEQAFRDLHGLTPAKPVDTITVKGSYL
jgi:hypothetical protein